MPATQYASIATKNVTARVMGRAQIIAPSVSMFAMVPTVFEGVPFPSIQKIENVWLAMRIVFSAAPDRRTNSAKVVAIAARRPSSVCLIQMWLSSVSKRTSPVLMASTTNTWAHRRKVP